MQQNFTKLYVDWWLQVDVEGLCGVEFVERVGEPQEEGMMSTAASFP